MNMTTLASVSFSRDLFIPSISTLSVVSIIPAVSDSLTLTPAIFIDGEAKIVGRVPSADELKELLGK